MSQDFKCPNHGDTINGLALGKRNIQYVWRVCKNCGQGKWIEMARGKDVNSSICKRCSTRIVGDRNKLTGVLKGSNHPRWKGGKTKRVDGYIEVWIPDDDFYYPMTYGFRANGKSRRNYVAEHRLIMAKHLGRCLLPWEVIHHKNGIKDDNRIENLELLPHNRFHLPDMTSKSYIKKLLSLIAKLQFENKELKSKLDCPIHRADCDKCEYFKGLCDYPYSVDMTLEEIKETTKKLDPSLEAENDTA